MQVLKGIDHFGNPQIHDERIIQKLQIRGKRVLTESTSQNIQPVAGSCNHSNECHAPYHFFTI